MLKHQFEDLYGKFLKEVLEICEDNENPLVKNNREISPAENDAKRFSGREIDESEREKCPISMDAPAYVLQEKDMQKCLKISGTFYAGKHLIA
jgi:hypothetical protein